MGKKFISLKQEAKKEIAIQQDIKPATTIKPATFKAWWITTMTKKKLSPALEQVLKLHFEARGFTKPESFDAGLADFGL